jgi:hypothetical protein
LLRATLDFGAKFWPDIWVKVYAPVVRGKREILMISADIVPSRKITITKMSGIAAVMSIPVLGERKTDQFITNP